MKTGSYEKSAPVGNDGAKHALTLDLISKGESAVIQGITAKGDMRRRLRDVGFCNGTDVKCVMKSPLGDPSAYLVRGTLIALRREDSRSVIVI